MNRNIPLRTALSWCLCLAQMLQHVFSSGTLPWCWRGSIALHDRTRFLWQRKRTSIIGLGPAGKLFGLAVLSFVAEARAAEPPPNIVFIVADDLGMQDVGFMGSEYFETPNLDSLADNSLVFDQAYMYPTCSPSRAAILTGQQSFRTECYNVPVLERGNRRDNIFSRWTIGEEHPCYAQPLSGAGYRTAHFGKWHIVGPWPEKELKNLPLKQKLSQPANGNMDWLATHQSSEVQRFYPTGRGFHENVGGTWWGDPARGYEKGYRAPSGGYVAPFNNPFIPEKDDDGWLTDRLTDDAIDFMKRNERGPFFVNLNFYAPHRPSVSRSEKLYEHFMRKAGDPETGQGMAIGKKKQEIAAYATMVRSVDENVGRIVDFLDQTGLRENTVLIFTSDNGFNGLQSRNDNLRRAKGYVYEGGIRVPALINWPNRAVPRRSEQPIQGLDFFPTFLELAGVRNFAGTLDGDSLVPLMQGKPLKDRAIFWHIASTYKHPPCSVIRKGDWKLIQFLKSGDIELYNLRVDLKESKNLALENPQVTKRLVAQLTSWRKQNQVPLPASSVLDF